MIWYFTDLVILFLTISYMRSVIKFVVQCLLSNVFRWRRNDDVTEMILKFDFVIIILKNQDISQLKSNLKSETYSVLVFSSVIQPFDWGGGRAL